jgi:hypothetical protein
VTRRGQVLALVAATFAVLASAADAKSPVLPETPIPVHVVFTGSGQFHDPSQCQISLDWSGIVLRDATAGCPIILAGPSLACMPLAGTPVGAFTQGVETDATGPGTASVSAAASGASGAHAALARRIVIASGSVKVKHAGRVHLRPKLTPAGTALFKRSRRVKVTIQTTFKPKSGHARTTHVNTVLVR